MPELGDGPETRAWIRIEEMLAPLGTDHGNIKPPRPKPAILPTPPPDPMH